MVTVVKCERCQLEIARYTVIGDQEFLHAGGILCREVHGVCSGCGLEIHWSVSDRKFQKLIEKLLNKKELTI
jgi:hypothetical protein